MKTPLSWLLGIAAVLALSAPVRPSYAQAQGNPPPAPAPAPASTSAPAKHAITVHFDYDFKGTPACPQPKDKPCVEQFIVYDIWVGFSPDKRFKLFTVALPPDAKGAVKGITGTSPPLAFQPGKHLIAVTAEMPNKKESSPQACQFWLTIP